ncbi:MAG: hypothetical protein KAT48_01315 [Bacteroidales bacterium]|nr:hypothetical protein [Bacteroidales bacterium]
MIKKIESDKVVINSTAVHIYNFLGDFNNFEKLVPDQVTDWGSSRDTCTFQIKGAEISMKITERKPFTEITVTSDGKTPVAFTMVERLNELSENQIEVQLILQADLNPFYTMILLNPLTNLVNIMVNKLKSLTENEGL